MQKRREQLTPDLTPLIDVVFILLIFFIVSSVFRKEELVLNVTLPTSSSKPLEIEKREINLELSTSDIAYNGEKLTLKILEEKLSKISDKNRYIIFRIDKDVSYEKVVNILDLLQKYSLNNLALITNKK
jgi:biopolymer transport protein ExbD